MPTSSPPTLRALVPNDVPAFRALLGVFATAFDEADTYAAAPPSDTYLRALLGQTTFVALVAEQAGAVIGGLTAYVLPKYEQARSEVYVYDLAVDAAHRRQGVATALLGAVQAWAAERGAWTVLVQADRDDPPAVALYDKLGTREAVYHFDLPPRPAGPN